MILNPVPGLDQDNYGRGCNQEGNTTDFSDQILPVDGHRVEPTLRHKTSSISKAYMEYDRHREKTMELRFP